MKCECGGPVKTLTGPGRVTAYAPKEFMPVPDDIATQVCEQCGEEFTNMVQAEALNAASLEYREAKKSAFHTTDPWSKEVYEWWHGERKITVYECSQHIDYLAVDPWEILEGPLTLAKFSKMWQWLNIPRSLPSES